MPVLETDAAVVCVGVSRELADGSDKFEMNDSVPRCPQPIAMVIKWYITSRLHYDPVFITSLH